MSTKIRELKDTLVQQNEAIVTLRRDREEVKGAVSNFYTQLAKYKLEYTTKATALEDQTYPDVRAEDLMKLSTVELLKNIAKAFTAVAGSVGELRVEVSEIYKELDQDIDDAMDQWQKLKMQESKEQKATRFREDTVANASTKRAQTPDISMADRGDMGGNNTLPPSPPDSASKANPKPTIKTDQPKSGTTTLEALLSPKPETPKTDKTRPPVKGNVKGKN